MFIALTGIDGSGKSTAAQALVAAVRAEGRIALLLSNHAGRRSMTVLACVLPRDCGVAGCSRGSCQPCPHRRRRASGRGARAGVPAHHGPRHRCGFAGCPDSPPRRLPFHAWVSGLRPAQRRLPPADVVARLARLLRGEAAVNRELARR